MPSEDSVEGLDDDVKESSFERSWGEVAFDTSNAYDAGMGAFEWELSLEEDDDVLDDCLAESSTLQKAPTTDSSIKQKNWTDDEILTYQKAAVYYAKIKKAPEIASDKVLNFDPDLFFTTALDKVLTNRTKYAINTYKYYHPRFFERRVLDKVADRYPNGYEKILQEKGLFENGAIIRSQDGDQVVKRKRVVKVMETESSSSDKEGLGKRDWKEEDKLAYQLAVIYYGKQTGQHQLPPIFKIGRSESFLAKTKLDKIIERSSETFRKFRWRCENLFSEDALKKVDEKHPNGYENILKNRGIVLK